MSKKTWHSQNEIGLRKHWFGIQKFWTIAYLGMYLWKINIIFTAPIIGHVGDGNLHCNIVYDPNPSPKHKDPIRYV